MNRRWDVETAGKEGKVEFWWMGAHRRALGRRRARSGRLSPPREPAAAAA
ncbi:MAG: hypothetical protein K0U69_03860 [Actinomycetia bacterium]|nr:hypothetical protein [Actinomycetes bacterium]MCH9708631.1 hypothetical protein [Actinomycetes bacterium]